MNRKDITEAEKVIKHILEEISLCESSERSVWQESLVEAENKLKELKNE